VTLLHRSLISASSPTCCGRLVDGLPARSERGFFCTGAVSYFSARRVIFLSSFVLSVVHVLSRTHANTESLVDGLPARQREDTPAELVPKGDSFVRAITVFV
jgi:hypothetical protein